MLNVNGFFDPLFQLLDHMVEHRFLQQSHREQLLSAATPAAILELAEAHRGVTIDKWMDRV